MNWQLYVNFLKGFFIDGQFFVLIISTIVLFFGVYIMWYLYNKQLSNKDLFKVPKIDSESKFANFMNRLFYFSKYVIIFPVYSFIWFLIFSFILVLIAKTRTIEEIMFFGIVIVSVTRISAYVSPKLAEDMAKLLPWALIIIFLTDPKSITLESIQISFYSFVQEIPKVAKYLIFITFVEWVLRIGNCVISPNKEKK